MNKGENEEDLSPEQSLKLITGMIEKVQDDKLRRVAKKRVAFKISLAIAILINAMLVCIWYFTSGEDSYFWPKWPMLVWSIALLLTFSEAVPRYFSFFRRQRIRKIKKIRAGQKIIATSPVLNTNISKKLNSTYNN